ncbi:hypothetical protein M427DRAFT_338719 [Gonapodya prolifera JEL478]|uniref:Uncharacterized protein n=1 Tax=Gonapodya prolifera (strain JEL478) TaxID=1344416 RepID=A0A139ACP4_GONPJ|nr:hypothetical protein M427DRAFT_338719 [Gonapodya prolifera JEL478]|eukprot:KXS14547.1 hypothetical protein M427DRAFT_338719 [Gonapodya prolifera JEL478]
MSLPLPPRLVHFALPVSSLDESLIYFRKTLGMSVLRHDSFPAGGEMQFLPLKGGPSWSRTMVGYSPEGASFALGLKHNPALSSYRTTGHFKFHVAHSTSLPGVTSSPDGYRFETTTGPPRIIDVEVAVREPAERASFLSQLVGQPALIDSVPSNGTVRLSFPYRPDSASSLPGEHLDDSNASIVFSQAGENDPSGTTQSLDHGEITPRVAIAVDDVDAVHARAASLLSDAAAYKGSPFRIILPPTTTGPGRSAMRMSILRDADGYEWVFVGWEGFFSSLGEEKKEPDDV